MFPNIDLTDFTCWVIFASAGLTSAVATLGLVSPRYKDNFAETLTLSFVALMGFVVTLQIYEYGYARRDGMAALAAAFALQAVVQAYKIWRTVRHEGSAN
jgi:hypothetical protein